MEKRTKFNILPQGQPLPAFQGIGGSCGKCICLRRGLELRKGGLEETSIIIAVL